MKKVFFYTVLFLSILSFNSCLQDSNNDSYAEPVPVFFLDATFDGSPKLIEAGRDEFFMYTNFTKDNFDVYTFIGSFGKVGSCNSDCTEDFTFFIRDSKASPEEEALPFQIETDLLIGNYGFLDDSIPPVAYAYELLVTDHSVYSGELLTTEWDFPGLEDAYPTSEWSDTISTLNVEASLSIETLDGCTSVYNTTLTDNFNQNCFYPVDFNIDTASIQGAYELTPFPIAGSPDNLTYSWSQSSFEPGLLFEGDGTHCVTITDVAGCSHQRCVTITNVAGGLGEMKYCSAGFSYEANQVTIAPTVQDFDFTNITLNYTDRNGILYSSAFQPQPESSFFEVLSISEFDFNEQNYPTLQLSVRFDCVLFNANGEELIVKDASASVGVAYPAGN